MSKKSVLLLACVIGGLILGAWFLSLPLSPAIPPLPSDIGWRSIQKTANGWERGAFMETDTGWKSFQEDGLLVYGKGSTPQIDMARKTIDVSGGGEWFVQLVNRGSDVQIKTAFVSGRFSGGTLFVHNEKKMLMNFDTEFTSDTGELLGPSFMLLEGKQVFFDMGEQHDLVEADMWGLYTVFAPRDEKYVLGNAEKNDLDVYIQSALEREPAAGDDGFFKQDISARNNLEEVQSLIGKIEKDEPCGTQADACFMLLDQTLLTAVRDFPDVFVPLQRMVQSWMRGKKSEQQIALSWQDIFSIYHDDIVAENPRAKVKRDNAILQMIRTSQADATYDVWKYLTNMLAKQKIGSAYSIQIMREMIRIGDTLSEAPTTTPDERSALKKTALESLTNLRSILENTYFTKKDYLFVLRSDLVDSEGKPIQTQVFVNDLQSLVDRVNASPLFDGASVGADTNQIQLIRGQLTWFTCILGKNDTYVKNPRVCRTTTG